MLVYIKVSSMLIHLFSHGWITAWKSSRARDRRWLHYKQTWMAFMYIPGNSKGCQKLCLVSTHNCMTAHSSQHKVIG